MILVGKLQYRLANFAESLFIISRFGQRHEHHLNIACSLKGFVIAIRPSRGAKRRRMMNRSRTMSPAAFASWR
jgi:hypothetical protein